VVGEASGGDASFGEDLLLDREGEGVDSASRSLDGLLSIIKGVRSTFKASSKAFCSSPNSPQ
jgi:hypothetical protein